MLNVGIIGLPNVGKSTLYNALSKQNAPAENYPFCTIEPNHAIVEYLDERVEYVGKLMKSQKIVKPAIEFVDIAGLVKGASKGEGLGNKFLDHIRKVDAIAHVVRVFEDPNVTHVSGKIDPVFDAEIVDFELIQKDLETVNARMEKSSKMARIGDKDAKFEMEVLEHLKAHLDASNPARTYKQGERDPKEQELLDSLFLISEKPVIYVSNVDDETINNDNQHTKALKEYAANKNCQFFKIPAKLIYDLEELSDDERIEFLEEFQIKEDPLQIFIMECKELLNLITFITGTENESKSWNVLSGTTAYEAAGKIHTDIQKGFIKAEVIGFDKLQEFGDFKKAREHGALMIEGKDYKIKEGDCVYFHFH